MYQRNIDSMSNATINYNNTYSRLAAGQVLLSASDNPAAASQVISYQNTLSGMNQYDTARSYAQNSLSQEDNVLNSISGLLTKNLSEKIVAGGNGTYSDADREALATELEGIRDNLIDLGNSKNSSGRYIFAGYKTGSEPFLKDGTYVGGDSAMTQIVADSTEMQVGHTGSDLFLSVTDDDLFNALNTAIEALRQPVESDEDREALQATLDSVNVSVKKNIDNLGKIQASVGTNLQQLEQLGASSDTQRINVETRYQESIGSDSESLINLITQSKMSEFALNSSMLVFQAMQKMTLFNMI
jgi:flagellar hook-associated protein 3 FlgL